jgi:hypothetical protein
MILDQLTTLNTIVSLIVAIIALIVSVIALVYTAKTYRLKSGANIRGSYSIRSSIECEDKFLHEITLENLKDRPVVIFKIFLKLGHNYFIEIDDFEDSPLILKPFEVFHREYEPIDMYSVGMGRILLNDLFEKPKVKKGKKEAEEEEEEEVSDEEEEEEEPETFDENPAMLDKYKTAATIASDALKHVMKLCVAGADIADICVEGDKKIDDEVIILYVHSFRRWRKCTRARRPRCLRRASHSLPALV